MDAHLSIVYDGRNERAVISCLEEAVRSHFLGLSREKRKYCLTLICCAVIGLSLQLLCSRASAQTFGGPSVNAALSQLDQSKFQEADHLIGEAIATGKCPGAVLLV